MILALHKLSVSRIKIKFLHYIHKMFAITIGFCVTQRQLNVMSSVPSLALKSPGTNRKLCVKVAPPRAPKGVKKPLKAPNWPKSHFLPYISSSIHQTFMKCCQNLEALVINIKVLLLTLKKLVPVPGAFRAKKYPFPFWGLF